MPVKGGTVVDPGRPDFHPGIVAPIEAIVAAPLQPIDVVDELLGAILAEPIGNARVAVFSGFATAACRYRGAAALTDRRTAGALIHLLNRQALALVAGGRLPDPSLCQFVAYGYNICHGKSKRV